MLKGQEIRSLCAKECPEQEKEVRPSSRNKATKNIDDPELYLEQDHSENFQTLFSQKVYHSMIPTNHEDVPLEHLNI